MFLFFLAIFLLLGLSLFFHLLGFWVCSLLSGVSCSRLVLGFGPTIFAKKTARIRFSIRLFPLGGYVVNPPAHHRDGDLAEGLGKMETSKFWKFIVGIGGTFFSLLLSVLLFAIPYSQGERIVVSEIGPGGVSKEVFFVAEVIPGMPSEEAGIEVGDQPLSINGVDITSFKHLFDTVQKTDPSKPATFVVRKGGEVGPERTYDLTPIEKEIINGEGVMQKTKLLGFRPRMKTTKVYGNPFSWSYEETKSTFSTFGYLFNPFSNMNQLDAQPRLRNMSGPVSTLNSIDRRLGGIGLKRVLILFAFLNLFFLAKAPLDLYRVASFRSGVLF